MNHEQEQQVELRRERENIRLSVNSLELCWGCDRVCECEQWLVNEATPVWLCLECTFEAAYRLEKQSGVPISLLPVCL